MELHNETTLTPEIIYSVNTRAKRSLYIVIITLLLVTVSFVLSVWNAPSPDWMFLGIYLLGIVVLGRRLIKLSPGSVKRRLRKQMGEKMICRYVFKDEEVILSSQDDYSSQEWNGRYGLFQKLKVKKQRYLCLYFDLYRYLIVDKNGFASEEEWNQLLEFLKTKNLS